MPERNGGDTAATTKAATADWADHHIDAGQIVKALPPGYGLVIAGLLIWGTGLRLEQA